MIKEHRELIKDIFDNDKEIKKYCDIDFDRVNQEISDQIIFKINKCLIEYPTTYIFANQDKKFFAVWLLAHNDWILYSFGVHPDKRDNENLNHFWNYLENEHDEGFLC